MSEVPVVGQTVDDLDRQAAHFRVPASDFEALKRSTSQPAMVIGLVAQWDLLCNVLEL